MAGAWGGWGKVVGLDPGRTSAVSFKDPTLATPQAHRDRHQDLLDAHKEDNLPYPDWFPEILKVKAPKYVLGPFGLTSKGYHSLSISFPF